MPRAVRGRYSGVHRDALNPDVHSASSAGENVIQIKDSYGEEDRGGERTMGRKRRTIGKGRMRM